MPNRKTDTNNNCAVSTDYIGQNYLYPEATYAERKKILEAHETYQKGLMWTLAHHPRVPEKIRTKMAQWGLARDEFVDNGHWPHQIYVREARRMVSSYVITERDCRALRKTPQSVGMGSYNMDSHNCMRYVDKNGHVQNEGDVQVSPGGPYQISYLSIVPFKKECTNLLVPICLSSSHIAYGSIRMEPVFMVLGQSAGTAASLCIDQNIALQDLEYRTLRDKLLADKQVLEFARPAGKGRDPKSFKGVIIDDDEALREGFMHLSKSLAPFVGSGYRHDAEQKKNVSRATFIPHLPEAGRYEIRLAYTASTNRAETVPVIINHLKGSTTKIVNQKKKPPIEGLFISLGVFECAAGKKTSVVITNQDTTGHVVIDAVQFLPVR